MSSEEQTSHDAAVWQLHHVRRELQEQAKTAFPSILSMIFYKIPWLISIAFVGYIGSEELAAAALATTLCNVTGMSISVGLSSALTTLTGQACGELFARREQENVKTKNATFSAREMKVEQFPDEKDPLLANKSENGDTDTNTESDNDIFCMKKTKDEPLLPLIYLYRGLFIQMMLVIPVGIWWLKGIKPVLLALGQGEVLSEMTEAYLKILTPGLFSYSINWTFTTWLQAIGMADVPAYASFFGFAMHVPMNLFFLRVLGWGYLGVAVATVMFQLVQPTLAIAYLFGTRQGSKRVLDSTCADVIGYTRIGFWKEAKLAICSYSGICQYLSLALPGIVVISEWWASELMIFLSGRLLPNPAIALDGLTIYQSINSSCFMIPVGLSVAGSTRVGTLLGSGDATAAKFAAKFSVLSAVIVSATLGSILYFTPHTLFPSFFSPDEDVILETSRTISLLSIYVVADGITSTLYGVLKGCGRQCVVMPAVFVAYWVFGVPMGYYISFIRNDGYMCTDNYFCGIVGLVAGLTIGTCTHMTLLRILVCTTNWSIEVKNAQKRLFLEKEERAAIRNPASPCAQRTNEMVLSHI